MHTFQPATKTETTLRTSTAPAAVSTADPTIDIDTEQYQSAKGCLMLSLFTVASGVVCAVVGYGIHMYIEATTGT